MPLKFLTHAALVESAVWFLFIIVLVWWRSRTVLASAAVGLAAALAVHAHPSTLLIAGGCCALVTILGVWNRRWYAVLAMFAGGIFLFVPYLIEQTRLGWEVLSSVNRYVGTDVHWPTVNSILRLVAAAFVNGHSYELQYLGGLPAALVNLIAWTMAGLLLAVTILAIGRARWFEARERTIAGFALPGLAALVAQAIFLVSIRPITPLWMMFSLLPLSAALLACVLSLVPDTRWGRGLRTTVFVLSRHRLS